MLTQEAYERRFWGPLETIREVLKGKRVSNKNYGSSISDNAFEAVSRHLTLSVLVDEQRQVLTDAVSENEELMPPLLEDLSELESMLRAESGRFEDAARGISRIRNDLWLLHSEKKRGQETTEGPQKKKEE